DLRRGRERRARGAASHRVVDRSRAPASHGCEEMTTPQHRFLIIADGDFGPLTSKTANSCIRYFPERIVAVFDRKQAGKTVQEVLGFGGRIPVVADFSQGHALGSPAVLVGI